jgi:hypothetical protein
MNAIGTNRAAAALATLTGAAHFGLAILTQASSHSRAGSNADGNGKYRTMNKSIVLRNAEDPSSIH